MVHYKDKFEELERTSAEEVLALRDKVASLQTQCSTLERQTTEELEQTKLKYSEKEADLKKEVDKERSYADKVEAELKTRERQLRKIQDKIDEEDKRYTDVQSKIEIVA